MLKQLVNFTAILFAVLALTGCVQRIYEVRMSPRAGGAGWDRVLTVTEHRHEKDAQGKDVPRQERRVTQSMFARDIASDMGNAGSITTYLTTLGTLTIYTERFRGQTAVADGLEARLAAANDAARLIGGWLKSESGAWPGAATLDHWCDHELRTDLRDLAVHVWLTGVDRGGARDPAHSAGWLRVVQFLTERGYFEAGDLSQAARLLMGGAESEMTHRWLVGMIARKAGDAGMAANGEPPAFLRSWQSMTESLSAYLRRQPEFDALVAHLEAQAKSDEEKSDEERTPPEPTQVLGDRLGAMVNGMVPLFANEAGSWSETLDLQIAVPIEPFATNGRWRAADSAVRWVTMVDGPDEKSMYPLNVYAQWAMPDEGSQKQAFGSVALRGVALAKYCLWRTGLTETEGRAWDAAVAALRTGMDVPERLKDVGIRGGIPEPLLDSGINIIRDGLDSDGPTK